MDIELTFPSALAFEARRPCQPAHSESARDLSWAGSAPTPFQCFVASFLSCAGSNVLGFLSERGLPIEGLGLRLVTVTAAAGGVVAELVIEVQLPAGFPQKYRAAIERAVGYCLVRQQFADPPRLTVHTTISPFASSATRVRAA